MLGVSLVHRQPRPVRARSSASPTGVAYTVARARDRRPAGCCPWSAWESVFGPLSMNFSTWIVSGPDGRRRRGLGDRLQRRPAPRCGDGASSGASRPLAPRPADVDGLPAPQPLPHRARRSRCSRSSSSRSSRAPTSSGSFQAALRRRRHLRRRLRHPRANTARRAPIADMRAAARNGASAHGRPTSPSSASQSVLAVDARQLGHRRGRSRTYHVRGLDGPFLAPHDVRARRDRARLRALARRLDGAARARPGSRSSTASSFSAATTSASTLMPSDFQVTGFYARRRSRSTRSRSRSSTSRPVEARRLTVIGVLADSAPFEMSGISTSQSTLAAAFPGRTDPTIHYFDVAPGVDPGAAATRLESAFLANGLEAESIQQGRRRLDRREPDVQPPDPGLHGARPRRRRRGPRRDQRPGRRRAAPADRRDARDRLPARR